ncbi:MAG TPA: L-lactate permease [Acidobacteriota bacterium]|nr:L-lactate permease [Acidobacteriota bacterium]
MLWSQNYDPLHSWPLSTIVAALPVLTLFFVLLVLKKRVWISALCGFVVATGLAASVFRMPAMMISATALHGFVFGFFQIAWIIIASIFLYNISLETGQFDVMKQSIASLSRDVRVQTVLIAFCFGAFLEGTGGGGAPVAIAGSFLIGLGFPPFQAAVICLIANTAPVAWGGVGNPVRVLAGVTGLPEHAFNAALGRILPPFALILPLYMMLTCFKLKKTREVFPALLVSGASFAAMQFAWSNFGETSLVDIMAAVFSLLSMVVFLKFWEPKNILAANNSESIRRHSAKAVLKGWSPFILASVLIFLFAIPSFNGHLKFKILNFPIPGLHNQVIRIPPIVPKPAPEEAKMNLNVLALPGTAIFIAAFIAAPFLGLPFRKAWEILRHSVVQLAPSLFAITFMLGMAYTTRYSGMDTIIGLSLTRTGWIYPLFGTLLGWIGVALTGTDAGSNALFGNLQKITAEQLHLSPILMGAANSAGGVMGKMISPQSLVVAAAATKQAGREAEMFKAIFRHSVLLAVLVGLLVLLYAYLLPGIVSNL